MSDKLIKFLNSNLMDYVPFNVAIIDKDLNIVSANKQFQSRFGDWKNKKCYHVCKNSDQECIVCKIRDVFATGKSGMSNESGFDVHNKAIQYTTHFAPMANEDGEIEFVMEISTDVADTSHWQKEYNLLFEKVSSYIAIIDRDFKIIRSNEKFRETFGVQGTHCYEVLKKRNRPCVNCPAKNSFEDGMEHCGAHVGETKAGDKTNFIANTYPLQRNGKVISQVVIVANDITEINKLQEQMVKVHDFYATLINKSKDAILAVDVKWHTQVLNPRAKDLILWKNNRKPSFKKLQEILPKEFFDLADEDGIITKRMETTINSVDNTSIPVSFEAIELRSKNEVLGRGVLMQDLRKFRTVEWKRFEAEKYGAIGHATSSMLREIKQMVKNIETGLDEEGKQIDAVPVRQRLEDTYTYIDALLDFSAIHKLSLKKIDPINLLRDSIRLVEDKALNCNINVLAHIAENTKPLYMDQAIIQESLVAFLEYSIDAICSSGHKNGKIDFYMEENEDELEFIIEDNSKGLSQIDIEQFFSSLDISIGNKISILNANKYIKEHDGIIEISSNNENGNIFKISFSRRCLEILVKTEK